MIVIGHFLDGMMMTRPMTFFTIKFWGWLILLTKPCYTVLPSRERGDKRLCVIIFSMLFCRFTITIKKEHADSNYNDLPQQPYLCKGCFLGCDKFRQDSGYDHWKSKIARHMVGWSQYELDCRNEVHGTEQHLILWTIHRLGHHYPIYDK